MSFKRDGDDKSALDNQRKRRVTELLYEDIHDGEVSRLSNGRYVCSICPHRPMFDTLNMFQVHRQGKKHERSLAYKERERLDLKNLIEKRRHEQFVKADNCPTTSQTPDIPKVLGGGLSCSGAAAGKKHGGIMHQRKIKLNVSQPVPGSSSTDTTKAESLPGNQPFSSKIQSQKYSSRDGISSVNDRKGDQRKHVVQGMRDLGDSTKLVTDNKHVSGNMAGSDRTFTTTNNTGTRSVSARGTNASVHGLHGNSSVEKQVNASDIHKLVMNENPGQTSKFYFARRQQQKDPVVSIKAQRVEKAKFDILHQQESKSWEYFKNKKGPSFLSASSKQRGKDANSSQQDGVKDGTSEKEDKNSAAVREKISTEHRQEITVTDHRQATSTEPIQATVTDLRQGIAGTEKMSTEPSQATSTEPSQATSTEPIQATAVERKERAEKFLNAYSSGWKKDWTGKWVRDEDVEFDSDEEPPDVS